MIVKTNGDEDDKQRIGDSADDSDCDDAPVANPSPKLLPKKIRNKKSEPKLTLDFNFICASSDHIRSSTNCSVGERRTFILSPRWNDLTPTIAGIFTLIFRQHGPLRNRRKHSTRLVLAVSVTSISMPSQIIPCRQSAQSSSKIFRATYWRTYWTAPSVVDSLYALRRRTTMTN